MFKELLEENDGQKIASKRALPKDKIGVEINSESLHTFYAFPSIENARRFMTESSISLSSETNEITFANIFENTSLAERMMIKLGDMLSKVSTFKQKRRFVKNLERSLAEADFKNYGMSFKEASLYTRSEEARENFEAKYGISYTEYLERSLGGEEMGLTMKDGRWKPRDRSFTEETSS